MNRRDFLQAIPPALAAGAMPPAAWPADWPSVTLARTLAGGIPAAVGRVSGRAMVQLYRIEGLRPVDAGRRVVAYNVSLTPAEADRWVILEDVDGHLILKVVSQP